MYFSVNNMIRNTLVVCFQYVYCTNLYYVVLNPTIQESSKNHTININDEICIYFFVVL